MVRFVHDLCQQVRVLGCTTLKRNRKVFGIPLPNVKIDLSDMSKQIGEAGRHIGEAGRQFGKLASEVREAREKAEKISKAIS